MSKTQKVRPMPAEIAIDSSLLLRQITPDDDKALFKIIQDSPEIRQNVSWPGKVYSTDDARRAIEQLLKEYRHPYVLQEDGITIGFAGTWGSDDNGREIGFSYFLAKNKRGRGYTTSAVQKLMEAAKQNLSVDTFVVNITEANVSSQAVAAKLGFKATDEITKGKLSEPTRRYERPA